MRFVSPEQAKQLLILLRNQPSMGQVWVDDLQMRIVHRNRADSTPKSVAYTPTQKDRQVGFVTFVKHPLEKIIPSTRPTAKEVSRSLAMAAAQGECESATLGIYWVRPPRFAKGLEVNVTPLRSSAGEVLPAGAVSVGLVTCIPQMRKLPAYGKNRWDLIPVPETIEAMKPFTQQDMFGNCSLNITPYESLQVWIRARIPKDAKPGTYKGQVTIRCGSFFLPKNKITTINRKLTVKVYPFVLQPPTKRYGMYYIFHAPNKSMANFEKDLRLMRDCGVTVIFSRWLQQFIRVKRTGGKLSLEYSQVERLHKLCAKVGVKTVIYAVPLLRKIERIGEDGSPIFGTAKTTEAERRKLLLECVRHFAPLAGKEGYPEVIWAGLDEVHANRGDLEDDVKSLSLLKSVMPKVKTYQTYALSGGSCRPFKETTDLNALIDIRSYCINYGELWTDPDTFYEHVRRVKAQGKAKVWCYYNTAAMRRFHTEEERLANGFWFWRSPFEVHIPCESQIFFGNPYVDNDSGPHGDSMTLFYPSRIDGSPVPTVTLEAYREGVDDMRYVATLEAAIAQCKAKAVKAAEVAKAEKLLIDLAAKLDSLRTLPKMAEALEPSDYDGIRRQIAEAVISLQVQQ